MSALLDQYKISAPAPVAPAAPPPPPKESLLKRFGRAMTPEPLETKLFGAPVAPVSTAPTAPKDSALLSSYQLKSEPSPSGESKLLEEYRITPFVPQMPKLDEKKHDYFRDELDRALLTKFPGTIQALASFQEDPFGFKKLNKNLPERLYETSGKAISDSIINLADRSAELVQGVRSKRSKAEIAGDAIDVFTGAAHVVFSPISALFGAAQEVPLLKTGADVLALPIQFAGETIGQLVSQTVESSGLDPEVKAALKRPLAEIAALGAQIVIGEAMFKSKLPKEAIEGFTKNVQTHYNLPRTVWVDAAKVKDIFQTGEKISLEEKKLVQSLGLDAEGYKRAAKNGIAIEIPVEKIITLADKPYWARLKETIGITSKPTVRVERPTAPKEGARALLEGPKGEPGIPEIKVPPEPIKEAKPISKEDQLIDILKERIKAGDTKFIESMRLGAIQNPQMKASLELAIANAEKQITAEKTEETKKLTEGITEEEIQTEIKRMETEKALSSLPDAPEVGYRSPTGFIQEKGTTAADVIRFEQSDLGNDLKIPDAVLKSLEGVPSDRLVWVTRTLESAKRYGKIVDEMDTKGAKIISDIGDDGLLVLLPDRPATAQKAPEVPQKKETPLKEERPFFVNIGGEGFRKVEGKPVKIEGVKDAFVWRQYPAVKGNWSVTEGRSGMLVGEGKTIRAAIEKAKENIAKATAGGQTLEKLIETAVKAQGESPRYKQPEAPKEKPKSQKEIVKEAVKKEPRRIKDIVRETKILEPNVRRILGVGEKEGTFKRVDKGVYILKDAEGKESAYIEIGDAKEVLARMADNKERTFDSVILDPAYFSRALIGGNRGIKDWGFIMPPDFASVMESIAKLVSEKDSHVYLMLSGARTAQTDMAKYVKGATDAGFKVIGEGGYKKLNKDGSPVTNVRGEEAAAERLILMTLSGEARAGEIPANLNFRFIRPSIAKSYSTEKPAELMEALIKQSTLGGETVLDPFAGSGVTGAEAIKAGRKPTLIEKKADTVEKFTKPRVEGASDEVKRVAGNIQKNNPEVSQRDAEAMARDVIEGRKFKASPSLDERAKTQVKELEKSMQEKLSGADKEKAERALYEVFAEISGSEAGQRIFTEQGVVGISSTFPKWIPEHLRSKELFDKVFGRLEDPGSFVFPDGSRTRQRELFNELMKEIDSRLGIDTGPERRAILEVYDTGKTSKIEELDRGRARGGEEIGEGIDDGINPEDIPFFKPKEGVDLGFNPKNMSDPMGPRAKEEVAKSVKRSDIAKELSEKLGVPIRMGKFNRSALGIFKPGPKVVRLKGRGRSGGLPTVFHEVGHFIDDKFGFSTNISITERKALMVEYGYSYEGQARKQQKEAFAEFLRFYMTGQKARAQTMAPEFSKKFEARMKDLPEIKEAIDTAAADYQRWKDMPATAKVFSQIAIGKEAGPGVVDRLSGFLHDTYTQALDDLHPISEFTNLAKAKGVDVPAQDNPYMLARNMRGWIGKADMFLKQGTFGKRFYEQKDGKIVPKFTGKSFEQIVKPIEEAGALNDFRTYLVSTRSIELSGRHINTGISAADARVAIEELNRKYPHFEEAAADLYKYQDALLDYVYENGGLDTIGREKIKALNQYRVPFYRVMEELQNVQAKFMGKGIGNAPSPIKKIKGSDRPIIDPIESIVKDTYALINAAERNAVGVSMAKLAASHAELGRLFERVDRPLAATKVNVGEVLEKALGPLGMMKMDIPPELAEMMVNVFRPSTFVSKGDVQVLVDGKPRMYHVDPSLYNALQGLDVEDVGTIVKILSYPSAFLRAGATLSPDFMLRNPIRDQFSAFVYSRAGFKPGVDLIRGMFELTKKGDAYKLWRMGGGEYATLVSIDRPGLQKNLKELLAGKGRQALGYVASPLKLLQLVSSFGEQATRLGEFKKALSKTKNPVEAAYASREVTLDFARIGAKTKAANHLIAFWNANVQGTDKMLRAFKSNPRGTWARTMIGITLPSILLYYANRDDKRWKEIPQWQKNLFWIILTEPGTLGNDSGIFRIPKPFELGIIFGSVPERILESMDSKDPQLFDELQKSIADGASPGIIPTGILPIIENISNHSFFLDRAIVPQSKVDLVPEAQYTLYTSETAKALGDMFNYSPAKIDNLIRGYFAGLGGYAVAAIDATLKGTGITHSAPRPEKTAADILGVKAFVIREPIGGSSESVNNFYDIYGRADSGERYVNQLFGKGEADKARAYLAENPEVKYAGQLRAIASMFSEINKAKDQIMSSTRLSPSEKRDKIDALDRTMTDTAFKALNFTFK